MNRKGKVSNVTARAARYIAVSSMMLMLVALIGCGVDASAAGTPIGSEPISTVRPTVTLTADQILSAARGTLLNAQSFEITKTTMRARDDGSHSDEITGKVADDVSAYVHSHHGRQITEVLAVPGRSYVRYSFVGQEGVKWQQNQEWHEVQVARQLSRELSDLENPRLIGTRERNGATLYVLEGTPPVPHTSAGIGIWVEIEPKTYTLEVDAESLDPVRLIYTYVSTLFSDGTPGPGTDVTVTVTFASVNGPVTITPPPYDEIVHPEDPTATPDPRYPQWPTPEPR